MEVLTPSTSECHLLGRWGLYRGNQVKMRPLGWALNQYDERPDEKGNLFTKPHTGRTRCEDKDRDWGDASTSQGTPKIANKLPEARGET